VPRDKSENNKKIIIAAKKEFLEQGFKNASMRKIAADAGITVGALYRHFENKEEMFASLVEPTLSELRMLYDKASIKEYERLKVLANEQALLKAENKTQWIMSYIYQNFDVFKLLVCCSQGTKYENFIHDMALLEEKLDAEYFDKLNDYNMKLREVSYLEFHMLVTANVSAMYEAVKHDFTEEQALHYAETIEEFFSAGWKKILGI